MIKKYSQGERKLDNKKNLIDFWVLLYASLWLFIGVVSTVDVVFTVALQEHLMQNEENPFARAILSFDNWMIARFIGLKMYGTIFVLGFLVWIYHRSQKFAYPIISTVSFFQLLLLLYLLL